MQCACKIGRRCKLTKSSQQWSGGEHAGQRRECNSLTKGPENCIYAGTMVKGLEMPSCIRLSAVPVKVFRYPGHTQALRLYQLLFHNDDARLNAPPAPGGTSDRMPHPLIEDICHCRQRPPRCDLRGIEFHSVLVVDLDL